MEAKTCLHCNEEKSINDFGQYKKKNGTIGHRNVCKICKNKQDRLSRKKTTNNQGQNINVLNRQNINREGVNMNKLKILANRADEIINLLDSKIEFKTENRANRTVRTINLDNDLFERMKEVCKKNDVSMSDLVNKLIQKGIEYL